MRSLLPRLLSFALVSIPLAALAEEPPAEEPPAEEPPAEEAPAEEPPTEEPPTEAVPAEEPATTPAEPELIHTADPAPANAEELPPAATADSVVLLAVPGRTFAGVLVADGEYVATLLELVQVGFPVRVGLADGDQTRARLVARELEFGLALLRLDAPTDPRYAATPSDATPAVGDDVTIIGHGGASQIPNWLPEVGEMVSFSQLSATVAAVGPEGEDGPFPAFLIDRSPGEGDLGAPVFDAEGGLVGLVADQIRDGGDRSLVLDAGAIRKLLEQPRLEQPKPRQSHFQSWGGVGLAVHNEPLHFGGSLLFGARISIIDQIRLEPWFELLLGTRAPVVEPEAAPQTFWWSLETGLNLGYRLNIFNPRSRDYIVPNVGFRIGWNRFDHRDEALRGECEGGDCRWVTQEELVRHESLRPGIDIGLDVRKGKVRLGYRFFIAPANVNGWSMHRIFVTFDGFPLPIRFGDSN